MLAHQSFKKDLLSSRHKYTEQVKPVLSTLRQFDPTAALLDLPQAWASRDLVAALWKALPDEYCAYKFESEEALTEHGAAVLNRDLAEPVTLHLGWETFCVRATLEAAWYAWPKFCHTSLEAYNTCLYPESLRWYIVRAGRNLYPMDCGAGAKPELKGYPFKTGPLLG